MRCVVPGRPVNILVFKQFGFLLQTNTFQLIIAYDPSRYQTYVMHIYLDMGWNNEYIKRRSMIGYVSLKSAEEKSLQLAPSMKSTAFRLHSRLGNIGMSSVSL